MNASENVLLHINRVKQLSERRKSMGVTIDYKYIAMAVQNSLPSRSKAPLSLLIRLVPRKGHSGLTISWDISTQPRQWVERAQRGCRVRCRADRSDPERREKLTWPLARSRPEMLNQGDRPLVRSLARPGTSENGSG